MPAAIVLLAAVGYALGGCPGGGGLGTTPDPSDAETTGTPTHLGTSGTPTLPPFVWSQYGAECDQGMAIAPPPGTLGPTFTAVYDQTDWNDLQDACLHAWNNSSGFPPPAPIDFTTQMVLIAAWNDDGLCGRTGIWTWMDTGVSGRDINGEALFCSDCPDCDCAPLPATLLAVAIIESHYGIDSLNGSVLEVCPE